MTDPTPIDLAHEAMQADPASDAARLRFFERVADAELFVMLAREAEGDQITPELFPLETGPVIVAFDREDRLSEFAGRSVPYAALSGRALSGMLAGQGVGLGLNLDVAPSAILLDPDALDWLVATLADAPDAVESEIAELHAPAGLPEALLSALDAKLAQAGGLASLAYLVGTQSPSGARGHLLALIDVVPGAEEALAKAVGEALTFSGIEAGVLDVGVFKGSDPMAARLARVGLRFDLPQPEAPAPRKAPGSDPDQPPRLR
ncbi:MAG: SseB family protein [Marinibacterium sp.]|nr:SseB family protein [Marinibacterium sp.]